MSFFSLALLMLNIIFEWGMTPSVENIFLGIFASAFVALVTYFGAYHIEKKKTIGLLLRYCSEYIAELANFIPLLVEIHPTGCCIYKWEEVIYKIKNNHDVHNIVTKLCKIHEERLYTVDGYFPILKKEKENLNVHNLIIAFAKINCAIQYCDRAYLLNNNVIYQMERNDIDYSDDTLKDYLKIVLQNNNDEYKDFLELVKKVSTMVKARTVFEKNCETECS